MQGFKVFIFTLIVALFIAVPPALGQGDCKKLFIYVDFSGSMKQAITDTRAKERREVSAIDLVSATLEAALSEERPFEMEGCEKVTIYRFDSQVYDGPGDTVEFHRATGGSALKDGMQKIRRDWKFSDTYTDIAAVLKHIGTIVEKDQRMNRKLFVIASDFAHDIDSRGQDAEKDIIEFKRKVRGFQDSKMDFANPYRDMLLCFFVQNQDPQNDRRRQRVTQAIGSVIGEDMLFDSAQFTGEDFRKKIGRFFAPVSLFIKRSALKQGFEITATSHTDRPIIKGMIKVDCPRDSKSTIQGAPKPFPFWPRLEGHQSKAITMLDSDHPALVELAGELGSGDSIRCDVEFEGIGQDGKESRPLTSGRHSLYLGTFIDLELAKAEPVIKLGEPVIIEALVRLRGQLADPVREWPDLELTLSSRKPLGDVELSEHVLSAAERSQKETLAKIHPEVWQYQAISFHMNETSAWASLCTHDRSALVLKAMARVGQESRAEDESTFPGLRDESVISEGRDAHSLIEKVLIPLLGAFAAVSLLILYYPRPLLERLEVALAVFGLVITTLLVLVHDVFPELTNRLERYLAADVPRAATLVFCFLAVVFVVGYIRGLHQHPLSEQAIRDIVRVPKDLDSYLTSAKRRKFGIPLAALIVSAAVSFFLHFKVNKFSVCVFEQKFVTRSAEQAESEGRRSVQIEGEQ